MKRSRRTAVISITLLLFCVLAGPVGAARNTSVLLQEAIFAEETKGDLNAAIRIYEKIIEDDSAQRPYVAEAMYRLGSCYFKQQNEQKARAVLSKLVEHYSEQTAIIEKAQKLLERLSEYEPAALMPPKTFLYVELGSPGRQVETILNMLKGTPFENPLSVLGGGQKQPGQKTPADIMAALLNPSMMAEFKKMRGMAVGVYGIGNQPSMVVVLYPGKSDALRGIILLGLGMAGTVTEDIEGMHILQMGNAVAAAYDDEVVIIVQDPNQVQQRLTWCIRQYKGLSEEPTLASENKLFRKLGRKSRQNNAVTVWLSGADVFSAVARRLGSIRQSAQFSAVDGIFDLKSIEGVIAQVAIDEREIGVELNVDFKQGHKSLAYQLIRTPNLRSSAFKAVPSDAIGVLSFALSGTADIQAQRAQDAVSKLTGLSIGREIFSNIEQVTIFAVEPTAATKKSVVARQISPLLPSLGVAITSHNPKHTRQLLTELLEVVDLMSNASANEQTPKQVESVKGRYRIGTVGSEPLYCYIDQHGKTTVLALSEEVLEASLSALKSKQSALMTGPLAKTLNNLPPQTSKLALVNLGGAIRMADAHIHRAVETSQDPDNYPLSRQLAQLAAACEKTEIRLKTAESENNFNISFSADNLPALAGVFGMLAQLPRQIPDNLTSKAVKPQPAEGAVTSTELKKLKWQPGVNAVLHKVYFGTRKAELALLGEVKRARYSKLPELQEDTTYYWRVDEVAADGVVTTGDIWQFAPGGKLVAWWKFDEQAGDTAEDSSGKGNDGTLHNMSESSWVEGVDGGALEFDGRDNYVFVPDSDSIEFGDEPFTICFWMKNPPGSTNCRIIVNGTSGREFEGASGKRYDVYHYGSNFRFSVDDNKTKSKLEIRDTKIATGEWVHIAAVRDTAADKLRLYRNGRLRKTVPDNSGDISSPEEDLYIGAAKGEYRAVGRMSNFFKGTLDDIRIYNYALSKDEIKTIYKSTKKPEPQERRGSERLPSKEQQKIEAQIRMLQSQFELIDAQLAGKVDEQTRRMIREKLDAKIQQLQKQLETERQVEEQDQRSDGENKTGKTLFKADIELKM